MPKLAEPRRAKSSRMRFQPTCEGLPWDELDELEYLMSQAEAGRAYMKREGGP